MNYGGCPAVSGCIFAGNMNERAGSVNCGGINNYDSSPEITDCIFSGNESEGGVPGGGGALCSELGSPAVTGCIFSGNSAEGAWGKSGAVINLKSSPDFTNCVVAGNLATAGSDAAGGMYNKWSSPEIVNCTFSGNMARVDAGVPYRGDGIYNNGDYQMESHISLKNSILWSNGNEDFNTHDVDDNIEVYINSSITGDLNAEFKGNPLLSGDTWTDISYDEDEFQTVFIDDSPWWTQDLSGMFLRPDLDDARLLYIESSTDTEIRVWGDMKTLWNLNGDEAYAIHDLHLMAISPCIDSAEDAEAPEQDIEGNDRVDVPGAGITGTVSDMGAYEYQP